MRASAGGTGKTEGTGLRPCHPHATSARAHLQQRAHHHPSYTTQPLRGELPDLHLFNLAQDFRKRKLVPTESTILKAACTEYVRTWRGMSTRGEGLPARNPSHLAGTPFQHLCKSRTAREPLTGTSQGRECCMRTPVRTSDLGVCFWG